jgi:hypothetical protein
MDKVFEKVILEIVKRHWRKKLASCKSVWLPCTSQHDTATYEASGPRDPTF